MSDVINLARLRGEPTTFWGLPDGLRLEVASEMIGFGLDPTEYFDWEVGEV